MNINPYILLCIGCLFALLYATIITVGWWKTRQARREISRGFGVTEVPLYSIANNGPLEGKGVKTVSLTANRFTDPQGQNLDMASYDVYICADRSGDYPDIERGDLLLLDKESHRILYAITVPDLRDYR